MYPAGSNAFRTWIVPFPLSITPIPIFELNAVVVFEEFSIDNWVSCWWLLIWVYPVDWIHKLLVGSVVPIPTLPVSLCMEITVSPEASL